MLTSDLPSFLPGTHRSLLAVDIGNTNIHLGLWRDGHWSPSWRARTVTDKMPDEYGVLLRNFLGSEGLTFAAIGGVAISSVVPSSPSRARRRRSGTGVSGLLTARP